MGVQGRALLSSADAWLLRLLVTPEHSFASVEWADKRWVVQFLTTTREGCHALHCLPLCRQPCRCLASTLHAPHPAHPCSDTADATAALQLDGIPFRGNTLKIKRPKDYVPAFGVSDDAAFHGFILPCYMCW